MVHFYLHRMVPWSLQNFNEMHLVCKKVSPAQIYYNKTKLQYQISLFYINVHLHNATKVYDIYKQMLGKCDYAPRNKT